MSDRKSISRRPHRQLDDLERQVLRMVEDRPGLFFEHWQTRFRGAVRRLQKLDRVKPGPRGGWVLTEPPATPVVAPRGWDGW